jgi:hypothetical protein
VGLRDRDVLPSETVGLRERDVPSEIVDCRCGGRGGRAVSACVVVNERGRSGNLGASGATISFWLNAGLGLLPGIGGGAEGIASKTGKAKLGFRTGRLGGSVGATVGVGSFSVAVEFERDMGGVGMGDGEGRGTGLNKRLGSGGLGDTERDGGWGWVGISSLDPSVFPKAGNGSLGTGSTGEGSSKTTRSGSLVGVSVEERWMDGVTIGSGTERALPERAADLGGTTGLGFEGPATAPPPNLSFIADIDTGTSGSAPDTVPVREPELVSILFFADSVDCRFR